MRKIALIIWLVLISSCEEVVVVGLPSPQNLLTVEGWVTNQNENQQIRLTRSNGFAATAPVTPIASAEVWLETRNEQVFTYSPSSNGFYRSDSSFMGMAGVEYRLRIRLENGQEIKSTWEVMLEATPIDALFVDSFEENDPDNPSQQFTVFFPRISAVDPAGEPNFYRWRFFKNRMAYTEPESITIQDDRFFDGNIIPNNFRSFAFEPDDEIIVQFQSINQQAYDYLRLLRSQITSLGTSTGTTPAFVQGNLSSTGQINEEQILGYFGTVAISSDTTMVSE